MLNSGALEQDAIGPKATQTKVESLMKKLLALLIALLLQACANPSIVNVDAQASQFVSGDSVIYVARFEGDPDYVDAATDFFVAELEQRVSNRIVVGSAVRRESSDVRSGGNIAPVNLALEDADVNGANLLIMGKVSGHQNAATLNGFSTVQVYDVSSGNRIANFHRPSGKLMAFNVHQTIMAAVKRTAVDASTLF